jgi:catechol 2,3-dioxygenase-like lactoylglutathione lyase family enzyme
MDSSSHFLTVKDQAKSREFYVGVLGGTVVKAENPCYIKLANSWIILNSGGGPTPDKPEVFLEAPKDLNRVSSFLKLRGHLGMLFPVESEGRAVPDGTAG